MISNEKLMYAAKMVGKFLLEGLRGLMPKYPYIGDVRGLGLCIGIEIVCGRPDMKPAKLLAGRLLYKYLLFFIDLFSNSLLGFKN